MQQSLIWEERGKDNLICRRAAERFIDYLICFIEIGLFDIFLDLKLVELLFFNVPRQKYVSKKRNQKTPHTTVKKIYNLKKLQL